MNDSNKMEKFSQTIGNEEKSQLEAIKVEISVDVTDGEKHISDKRKAFIKARDKRICKRIVCVCALGTVGACFIDNIIWACICFTVCLALTVSFYESYKDFDRKAEYGFTPWWYFGL